MGSELVKASMLYKHSVRNKFNEQSLDEDDTASMTTIDNATVCASAGSSVHLATDQDSNVMYDIRRRNLDNRQNIWQTLDSQNEDMDVDFESHLNNPHMDFDWGREFSYHFSLPFSVSNSLTYNF